jgi:hypothetical protein
MTEPSETTPDVSDSPVRLLGAPTSVAVSDAIVELVAMQISEPTEERDERADLIASERGVDRAIGTLLGMALSPRFLKNVDRRGIPPTVSFELLGKLRSWLSDTYSLERGGQVVKLAAWRTDIDQLSGFTEQLRHETWCEMVTMSKQAIDYVLVGSRLLDIRLDEGQFRRAFLNLSPLQVVAFVAMRPSADPGELGAMLPAEVIAHWANSKTASVEQARSKARSSLGI